MVLLENYMFYSFELQMAGVILLSAMVAGGVSLWLRRRREKLKQGSQLNDENQNL